MLNYHLSGRCQIFLNGVRVHKLKTECKNERYTVTVNWLKIKITSTKTVFHAAL